MFLTRRICQLWVVSNSCCYGQLKQGATPRQDEAVIVGKVGTRWLGSPLEQNVTGEETAEDLGGADVHSRVSGVTDHYANDDRQHQRRKLLARLTLKKNKDRPSWVEPLYDSEEIYELSLKIPKQLMILERL